MVDFNDTIEWMGDVPILRILIKFLKKMGYFKDHKRLYQIENKIKALGNSFRRIEVPFEKILEGKRLEIPCLILLRQKDNKIFTSEKLSLLGFKMSHRAMGMYVLPPLEIIKYKIHDKKSLKKFFVTKFDFNEESITNLRFCILFDLNKQYYSFRHNSIKNKETKPVFDLIQEDIIKYLGEKKALRYVKEYYKEQWHKKESEIIASTPLQHISYEFLDSENFGRLADKEIEILDYMKKQKYIPDYSFLSLSKISKKNLKRTLIKFLGEIEEIGEISKKIIDQAEFMANRL